MEAVICDKCGRIFPIGGSYHTVHVDNLKAILKEYRMPKWHLCDGCLDELNEWMEAGEDDLSVQD